MMRLQLLLMLVAGVNSQLVLDVYRAGLLCPNDSQNVTRTTIALTQFFQPSCSQFLQFMGVDSTDFITAKKCFNRNSDDKFPPTSMTPTNPITGFAQQYNLFESLMVETETYSDFTAFRIVSCADESSTIELERDVDNVTLSSSDNCYSIPGVSNVSTTCVLSQLNYLKLSLSYSFSIDYVNERVIRSLTGDLEIPFSNTPISCASANIDWELDVDASLLTKRININQSFAQFDSTVVLPPMVFTTDTTEVDASNSIGGTDALLAVASTVSVTLNPTIDTTVDTILVETVRPLQTTGCSTQYRIAKLSKGRNWGNFMKLREYNETTATLTRSSTPSAEGKLALEIQDNGCFDKCASAVLVHTPGAGYNPFYSPPGPLSVNQMKDPSNRPPTYESNYNDIDCLCGVGGSAIEFEFNDNFNQPRSQVRALISTLTGTFASESEGVAVLYTVTSGAAFSAQAGRQPIAADVPSVAGGTVAAVVVFAILVALFFLFSNVLTSATTTASEFFSTKTTTPLASVQLFVVLAATSMMIAAVGDDSMVSIFSVGSDDTTSIGFWYQSNNFANLALSQRRSAYPCLEYTELTGMAGEYDYRYVETCGAARVFMLVAVVGGVAATGLMWFNRSRMAVVIVLFVTVFSSSALGLFVNGLVQGYVADHVVDTDVIRLGSSTYLIASAVFFYICAVVAWFVDWRAGETEVKDKVPQLLPRKGGATNDSMEMTSKTKKDKPKKEKKKKEKTKKEKLKAEKSENTMDGAPTLSSDGPPLPTRNTNHEPSRGSTSSPYGEEVERTNELYEDTQEMETEFGQNLQQESYDSVGFVKPSSSYATDDDFNGFDGNDAPPPPPKRPPPSVGGTLEPDEDDTYDIPEKRKTPDRRAVPLPPPPTDEDMYEAVDHPDGRFDGFA